MQPDPYQAQSQPPYQPSPYREAQLRYIGFWWRVLAYLIDVVVLCIVYLVVAFIVGFIGGVGQFNSDALLQVVNPLVGIFYFIWLEAAYGGTAGKLVLGLRVRKVDGSPIGWKEAIIRNLILIIEGCTLCIVTIITIARSPLRQRWGDSLAGTIVVKAR